MPNLLSVSMNRSNIGIMCLYGSIAVSPNKLHALGFRPVFKQEPPPHTPKSIRCVG